MSYQRNLDNTPSSIQESQSIFEELEPIETASKWLRFANFIIDYIAVNLLIFIIAFILGDLGLLSAEIAESRILNYIVFVVIGFPYYAIFEYTTKGKTLGKYVTNTKTVSEDDGEINLSTVLIRSISRFIPFNPLSFLGSNSTGWHDSISKTKVIKEQ